MRRPARTDPAKADLYFGWFYSAAIGGSIVALFFLAVDALAGQPLRTPSLLGSALFFGEADPGSGVDLTAAALFTAVHFLAFGALGLVASAVHRWAAEGRSNPAILTLTLTFVVAEAGVLVVGRGLMPGAVAALGVGTITAANAAAAAGMTLLLEWARRQSAELRGASGSPADSRDALESRRPTATAPGSAREDYGHTA